MSWKPPCLSRYADPATAPGDLDTSVVAVLTDVMRGGRPVVGLGYGSVGRYAQGGLIRARFAPRLLQAPDGACADASTGNLDPALAWRAMMAGEKGGHGERCVAVGALDMAIWDAAAKIADEPLCRHIARRRAAPPARVPVYAGGGYLYPRDDEARLADEARACVALGFNRIKIKIGGADLDADRRRIETVLARLPTDGRLAVDAMNAYGPASAAVRLWPVVVRGHLRPAGFRDAGGRGGQLSVADRRRRGPVLAAGGACWRGMAACVRIATCWCSIPRIATASRPMFESSRNSWRAAGPRGRSGRMAGTCSACTWRRDWGWAAPS